MPQHSGVLSALGMAAAADMTERSAAVHLEAAAFAERADSIAAPLAEMLATDLPDAEVAYIAECRYAGQGYELDVPCAPGAWARLGQDFHDAHGKAYGHRDQDATVEVVELRAVARRKTAMGRIGWQRRETAGGAARLRIRFRDGALDAAGYQWSGLRTGQVIAGPAVVESPSATALIPPGWTGRVNELNAR
jgi:N-methylhydantoinase A